jgi:AraC-like DNA-binding protein
MAFVFVDPRGPELARLATLASVRASGVAFDLSIEPDLIELLRGLADGSIEWHAARPTLDEMIGAMPRRVIDPRVKRVLDRLHADPSVRPSLADLARQVRLSESRLLHLFKATTGVPLRRYKIWIAMGAATRAVGRGASLTTAALDAGFSSSAHFSATFREMFGLEPSRLARGRLVPVPTSSTRRESENTV